VIDVGPGEDAFHQNPSSHGYLITKKLNVSRMTLASGDSLGESLPRRSSFSLIDMIGDFRKCQSPLILYWALGFKIGEGEQEGLVPRAYEWRIQNTRGRPVSQLVCSQRVERGERAGSEALRGDSARLRSARESPTKSKGSSRLFEVRSSVYFNREGKQSEVT
jgi:hypothetical protein